jgi:hypothetical protein
VTGQSDRLGTALSGDYKLVWSGWLAWELGGGRGWCGEAVVTFFIARSQLKDQFERQWKSPKGTY